MKKKIFYIAAFSCLFFNNILAQELFDSKAKAIALKIEKITKEEKEALNLEMESVNSQLEKGSITKEQAEQKKALLAETRVKSLSYRINLANDEMKDLLKQKEEGKLKSADSTKTYGKYLSVSLGTSSNNKSENSEKTKRTITQFVFAAGLNNLVTNESVAHSDFRYWGSHFYEWGFANKTRVLKNDNLLQAKYGFSVMYNNLRPTENRIYEVDGNQTTLENNEFHLRDSRFKNVYLVAPLHLEFDFSGKSEKDGKVNLKTQESFRFGLGGYAGVRLKTKQILKYDDMNNNEVVERTRGDFNANNFIYGLSTYVGYKATSLYLKYDLNELFKDNAVKQNNVSLGIRFDFD